ncbi:MAG: PSD1 and planctomycete cytochrome C domain-containing protein [Planctomycetaceae bacterium]
MRDANRPLRHGLATFIIRMTLLCQLFISQGLAADDPDFYRDVRPILARACFHCHGPDEETREAGLRLDRPEGLFGAIEDRQVVKKGEPDHSELIRRIRSEQIDVQMPPADSGKSLTPEQREVLVRWVASGASWKEHWAFIPPQRPDVPIIAPEVSSDFEDASEIDRFILEKLAATGLPLSSPADEVIQIRRVFLDLIGLPPTIEEADHWLAKLKDEKSAGSSDATTVSVWQELVDHLLSRPEYGERWARVWLDMARYADTNGYEKDRPRSIWPYRDWVINALNEDMPFDRFTVEQLAGDLLPDATVSQRIATGFHRNTMLNEEGGIDPLEFRFHAMTDRVATTGTTWLGLTVGCAQCHTHKYDPLTHREYYQLMAFLNNADEPSLSLPDDSTLQRESANKERAEQLLKELPQQWPLEQMEVLTSRIVRAAGDEGEKLAIEEPDMVVVSGEIPARTTYVVDLEVADIASVSSLRLSAFKREPHVGPGRADNGNFVLSEVQLSLFQKPDSPDEKTAESEVQLPLKSVTATVEQVNYAAAFSIDGKLETGWAIDDGRSIPTTAEATFFFDEDHLRKGLLKLDSAKAPVGLRIRLVQNHGARHVLGAFRLAVGQSLSAAEQVARRTEFVARKFEEWRSERSRQVVTWTPLKPLAATSNLPHLMILDDASILASGDTTKQDRYEILLGASTEPITALRLEALPDERLPGGGPGTTFYEGSSGDFYLNELSVFAGELPAKVASATESFTRNKFGNTPTSAALTLDGDVQTGWSVAGEEGQRHTAVYVFEKPVPAFTALKIQMIFGRHFASSLGRFRFSAVNSGHAPVALRLSDTEEQLLLKSPEQLTTEEKSRLMNAFLLNAPEVARQAEQVRQLLSPVNVATTLVMQERPSENPRRTYRHHRGEYLQPKEQVSSGTPEFLHQWPEEFPRTRLGFARWLVHRNNPLTARVIVNRQWAAFFGRGIVTTVDDFGIQGTEPSHPKLLDWLAVTFMDDDDWSLKSLHRRIVMSRVYRQAATKRDDAVAVDPENRLLAYAPRFRLDAEVIRDSIVQAAGVLSKKRGGPPVRPLQPKGITEVAFASPSWDVSEGEDRYRRSIYTFIKRTAPFAMVTTFDGPTGEACIARRNRSNTPLQALTLLNDPMFVDLARVSGDHVLQMSRIDDDQRIVALFRGLLTRTPDETEVAALKGFVVQHRRRFLDHPEQAAELTGKQVDNDTARSVAELATWTALSRAVFALDEVVMRP